MASAIWESARPRPPRDLLLNVDAPFAADGRAERWIRSTFIEGAGPLLNPDHEHLQQASIGVLWCSQSLTRQMRAVAGQAEMPQFQGNAWTQARQRQQMFEWFGRVPDFVLTFDAHYADSCEDREFCALVEHELYHCSQRVNEFGTPKFKKDGSPQFGIRGHDIEEFVGVVRRYGATEAIQELVKAAADKPLIKTAAISEICGNCRLKV